LGGGRKKVKREENRERHFKWNLEGGGGGGGGKRGRAALLWSSCLKRMCLTGKLGSYRGRERKGSRGFVRRGGVTEGKKVRKGEKGDSGRVKLWRRTSRDSEGTLLILEGEILGMRRGEQGVFRGIRGEM